MKQLYNYKGTVLRVVDGDTVIATVDLGFYVSIESRFRLARINAPEVGTPDGKKSKQELSILATGAVVQINCTGKDKYGRWVAEIQMLERDKYNLSDWMLVNKLAEDYKK